MKVNLPKKKTVLFVLPTIGDTKDSKRIQILQQAGYNVLIGAYERRGFTPRIPEGKIHVLGKIEDGKYLKRIWSYLCSMLKLRRLIKKSNIVYAVSPDLALITLLSSFCLRRPLIMDVADIREIEVSKSLIGGIVRLLDRFIIQRCALIVVTSQAFIDSFYRSTLELDIPNYYLLENKVDYDIAEKVYPSLFHKNNKKLRIGYFGVLRDNWTIEFLLALLSKYPDDYEVVIAGIDLLSQYDISELDRQVLGFHYLGTYRSPDDLDRLYSKIDVMAIFYPDVDASKNWFEAKRICRSNRFYEACYFQKPIIAFSFSEDGKVVEELNIGFTLSNYHIQEAVEKISIELTNNKIIEWKQNIQALPVETYKLINEPIELGLKIENVMNKVSNK